MAGGRIFSGWPWYNEFMLIKLFFVFFKIGAVTFGGGAAMAPILMREVVEKRRWMSEDDLIQSFALSQSIPGVIAVNVGVFVGHKLKGFLGALICAFAVTIPAVIGILAFVKLLELIPAEAVVAQGLKGVISATVALILCTVISTGKKVLKGKGDVICFVIAFVLTAVFGINAIVLLCAFALFGLVSYLYYRKGGGNV